MEDERSRNVFALHRYFIWYRHASDYSIRVLKDLGVKDLETLRAALRDTIARNRMLYALMDRFAKAFVVIEGYKELKLGNPEIDAALKDENLEKLRRLRNAVFHYQSDYWTPKIVDFLIAPGTGDWVTSVMDLMGKFFIEELKARVGVSAKDGQITLNFESEAVAKRFLEKNRFTIASPVKKKRRRRRGRRGKGTKKPLVSE